jgi:hypothetical protein
VLSSTASGQVNTSTNNSNNTRQKKQSKQKEKATSLRLFVVKPEFLKISVDLHGGSAAAATRRAGGQLNLVKLRMF